MSCICMTPMGGGGIGSFIDDSIAISSDGSALANDDGTSNKNICIGTCAGFVITTGGNNLGIGVDALRGDPTSKLTGSSNVGVGYQAGYSISTGQYNFLLGHQSGYSLSSGQNNINLGYQSAYSDETGSYHINIGGNAGRNVNGSFHNVFIGRDAGRYTGDATGAFDGGEAIAIGHRAYVTAPGEMSLGNSAYITAAFAAAAFTTRSDERQKDFVEMDLGLDFINALEPKKYTWNAGADQTTINYGFSAQQTRRCLDDAGVEDNAKMHVIRGDNPDAEQNLTYTEFIAPAIQAIQELSCLVDELRTEINAIKGDM